MIADRSEYFVGTTAALIEFRPENLDPAPDAGSVDTKAAFSHEIRHLPVAQREAQVPTHTDEDDCAFVMPPEERIGRPNGHRFTLPQSDSGFSQHNPEPRGVLVAFPGM